MHYDIFGRLIRIGDIVTYPCRQRSRCWTQVLRVDQVEPGRLGGYLVSGRHCQIWGRTLAQLVRVSDASLEPVVGDKLTRGNCNGKTRL